MRTAHSDTGFSLDGCKTQADVAARKEFLRHASEHQSRAHRFSDDDLRALGDAGREVQRIRVENARRQLARWRQRYGAGRWSA